VRRFNSVSEGIELAPRLLAIKAGTLLNIWLYFHHGTHA
jgi:hypothetical protein